MRALLGVNVLIAFLDAALMHQARATHWLRQAIAHGWAYSLEQNGCLRSMAQPVYLQALPSTTVASRLARAATRPRTSFWPTLLGANPVHCQHLLG